MKDFYEIEKCKIKISDDDDYSIETQTVEANLLFAILVKLEAIIEILISPKTNSTPDCT